MGKVVTVYAEEYLGKFEVREEIFTDRGKALAFGRELRKQGFTVKTKKFNDGREDFWEVTGKKAK